MENLLWNYPNTLQTAPMVVLSQFLSYLPSLFVIPCDLVTSLAIPGSRASPGREGGRQPGEQRSAKTGSSPVSGNCWPLGMNSSRMIFTECITKTLEVKREKNKSILSPRTRGQQ